MKMIPIFRCTNMRQAISFYTGVLDFEVKYPQASADDWVVDLINNDAELLLTSLEGDQKPGFAVSVRVENVDHLFEKYISRGLDISGRDDSPVHQRPTDQSWGMREFYVTDPWGNTLRFGKAIE